MTVKSYNITESDMTKDEAINKLIRIRQVQGPRSEAHEALGMAIDALSQPSLPEGLEEAAIDAAQLDMQDRQIMEDSNEHRMLYSRIFRRGFKAGVAWRDAQTPKLPDNLEEAAMASMPKPNGIESNTDFSFFQMVWMFEQGAEWMAKQGVSSIGSLQYANQGEGVKDELELFFHDIFPDDEWEEGELVIVQVRKKED